MMCYKGFSKLAQMVTNRQIWSHWFPPCTSFDFQRGEQTRGEAKNWIENQFQVNVAKCSNDDDDDDDDGAIVVVVVVGVEQKLQPLKVEA